MSGAREQVARLLALVPYLNTHPEVALEQAARDFGVPAQQIVRDLKVLWYCGLPGLGAGRPDRHRHGGAGLGGGRRDDPALQRRVPQPPAAAGQLRGGGAGGGAPRDAREQPRHLAGRDRPGAGQARARHRGRLGRRRPRGPVARQRTRPRCAPCWERRSPADGRSGWSTTCRRATRPPSAWSTRWPCWRPKGTPTSTPGATSRRPGGCSGWTGSTGLEVLDEPALEHDVPPRDLSSGLFAGGTGRPVRDRAAGIASRAGWRSTTRSSRRPSSTTAGSRWISCVGDPRWLVRLMMRLSPHARLVGPDDLRDRLRDEAGRVLAAIAPPVSRLPPRGAEASA